MEHLTDLTVEDFQKALESVEEKTPAQRLFAAIAYKNGISQSELAEWFDVERKTIYNWLTRLEEGEFDQAIYDDPRPGRPRKLSDKQLDELGEILHNRPADVGYDVPAWTVNHVRDLIQTRFEIEYSRPSCRRLMKELGLRSQTVSEAAADADVEDRETFEEQLSNLGRVWMPR